MAALILPSRRIWQPQGPVEIGDGNSIASGLVEAITTSNGRSFLVRKRELTPISGAFVNPIYSSKYGVGAQSFNSSASNLSIIQQSNDSSVTFLTVGRIHAGTTERVPAHVSQTSNGTTLIGVSVADGTTEGLLRGRGYIGGATRYWGGSFDFPAGTDYIAFSRNKHNVEQDLWVNGVRDSVTAAFSGNSLSYRNMGRNGAQVSGIPLYLAAFWNRALTDAEILELTQNPWQLFQPIQRRIWVEVGGGATNYTLTADVGAYTLTGESATTSRGVRMTGDVGSYALTGQDATTSRGYSLTGDVGAYSLTGESAGTQAGFRIGADTGAYSLTGQDATLTYSQGTTNYTLTAETGDYTLTGINAGTIAGRRLLADVGSYSLTGQNATTSKGTRLVADSGAYTLTGQDATLTATATVNYTLTCETGVYSLDGGAATFDFLVEGVQLLGGGPGLPRKKKRVVRTDLDKDSYLYRLLSPELRQEVPPEVAEVIEEQASQAVEQPKKPAQAKKDLRSALKDEGIAYREAYREALTLAIQEMQRQDDEEEEAIAVALASLI